MKAVNKAGKKSKSLKLEYIHFGIEGVQKSFKKIQNIHTPFTSKKISIYVYLKLVSPILPSFQYKTLFLTLTGYYSYVFYFYTSPFPHPSSFPLLPYLSYTYFPSNFIFNHKFHKTVNKAEAMKK